MNRKTTLFALVILAMLVLPPTANAAHSSSTYAQPVWFEWYKTDIDVLVIPPDHGQLVNYRGSVFSLVLLGGNGVNELNPYTSTYLAAVEESIAAWETAWQADSAWLSNNLRLNVYVVGRDTIPTSVLTDPEILVTTEEETNAYLGVSAIHGARIVGVPDCVVSNTKMFLFSLSYNDMYNLNMHEFGHCLGLEHIHGDLPRSDIMDSTYRFPIGNHYNVKKCISNVNIDGLERVFNGQGGSATIARNQYGCV